MTAPARTGFFIRLCCNLFIAGLAVLAQAQPAPQIIADSVFLGDNIITMDPADNGAVTGVAVRDKLIIATGDESTIRQFVGSTTRVVELGDNALLPGFIDAHGHFAGVARNADLLDLSSPPIGEITSIEDIVQALRRRIEQSQISIGEWVFAAGYDDSLLAEGRHPTAADLDQASLNHPIVLRHVSGHLIAANNAALSAAGISAASENPAGGVIRRINGSQQPNGVLEETAMGLLPAMSIEPQRLSVLIREAIEIYASYGITTVQDGGVGQGYIDSLRQMAQSEPFGLDIVAYVAANGLRDEDLNALEVQQQYLNGFRTGGVKFVLDGSPQGRTAWLTQPYTQGPPGESAEYRAYPSYDPEAYKSRMPGLIRRGIPVLAHANGDAAIDLMIDGVELALRSLAPAQEGAVLAADFPVSRNALPDHRTVTIHGQLMRQDQLDRIASLGIIPSYYAVHPFFWGDWHRLSFGEERAAFISPLQATLERGIPFTIHNDSPVVPPDMMRLLWVATNRETRSGHILGPDQRLSIKDALHAVTLGAAYQYFEEDNKGSISVGKQADLIILDKNPLLVNPEDLQDIQILETIARGKTVFKRQ